jgi:anaerobic selenocysteine-containing dehydrogenase
MQDWCRELNPHPLIEINPKDAEERGIIDGEWVYVHNMFGECLLKAMVSEVVLPGVVHAQHGWWFPEEDGVEPHLFGVWRSNINTLIPVKHIGKLGFGAPYKCMICDVRKTESEDYEKLGGVSEWHATVS